ncbi:MAG: hypothetical protein OCC49_16145 [Fibrobacterales bacterium]
MNAWIQYPHTIDKEYFEIEIYQIKDFLTKTDWSSLFSQYYQKDEDVNHPGIGLESKSEAYILITPFDSNLSSFTIHELYLSKYLFFFTKEVNHIHDDLILEDVLSFIDEFFDIDCRVNT